MKDDETGGTCSIHGRDIFERKSKEKRPVENRGIDGTIILNVS
jgi:hypothetical protein